MGELWYVDKPIIGARDMLRRVLEEERYVLADGKFQNSYPQGNEFVNFQDYYFKGENYDTESVRAVLQGRAFAASPKSNWLTLRIFGPRQPYSAAEKVSRLEFLGGNGDSGKIIIGIDDSGLLEKFIQEHKLLPSDY